MKQFTANSAQEQLEEVLILSQSEPVLLTRGTDEASVVLSQKAYQELTSRGAASAQSSNSDPIPSEQRQALGQVLETSRKQIAQGNYTPMGRSLRESMDAFQKKLNG